MYFNNGYDSTFEELLTFYPNFYRRIFELRAILEANGRICDNIIDTINAVLENSFIASADEPTIKRLEKFLGIAPDDKKTLEERRSLVHAHFVGFGKISASKIKEMVKAFTGADSTVFFKPIDANGNNALTIELNRGDNSALNFTAINETIASRIPAHIAYEWAIRYKRAVAAGPDTSPKHYTTAFLSCGTMLVSENVHSGELNIPDENLGAYSVLGIAVVGQAELNTPFETD